LNLVVHQISSTIPFVEFNIQFQLKIQIFQQPRVNTNKQQNT